MSNANGTDRLHLLQLRALAENLYLQANRHREHGNYIVAHALYGRTLATVQRVVAEEHEGNVGELVTKIQKDQHTVFELLRLGTTGSEDPPLEKAQKVGQ